MKELVLFLTIAMGAERLAAQQVLTDYDVVKMVQAGVAQDIILKLIAQSPVPLECPPDRLIAWKQLGVPDEITRAMVDRRNGGASIRYVHFSSEARVIPAKSSRGGLARLKIWQRK